MSDITSMMKEIRELEAENARLRREAKALRLENDRLRKELDELNQLYRQKVPKVGFEARRMHDILLPIVLSVYDYPEDKYREAMEGKRRWEGAVKCRHCMAWVLRKRLNFGLKKIAIAFGVDHSSICNALRRYEDLYSSDSETRIRHAEINFLVDQWDRQRKSGVKAG